MWTGRDSQGQLLRDLLQRGKGAKTPQQAREASPRPGSCMDDGDDDGRCAHGLLEARRSCACAQSPAGVLILLLLPHRSPVGRCLSYQGQWKVDDGA